MWQAPNDRKQELELHQIWISLYLYLVKFKVKVSILRPSSFCEGYATKYVVKERDIEHK